MIGIKLQDFIKENVQRTADYNEQKRLVDVLKNIVTLKPKELGHLLYIFASCERSHRLNNSPIAHFKHLKCALQKVAFALECDVCF